MCWFSTTGSPFQAEVVDKELVTLSDNLDDLKDENDHIVLDYGKPFLLHFDVVLAGPGELINVLLVFLCLSNYPYGNVYLIVDTNDYDFFYIVCIRHAY